MADSITADLSSGVGSLSSDLNKAASLGSEVTSFASRNKSKDDLKPKRDAFLAFRFFVQIDSVNVAEFTECSSLTIETEIFEYQEGGINTYTHKLPVRSKYSNITLKHGIDSGEDLFNWYLRTLEEPQPADASGKVGGLQANSGSYRRNISIICYDSLGKEVRRWDLHNAFPVKWVGPDWKAGQSAVAIESVEIAHAGLVPRAAPTVSSSAALTGSMFGAVQAGMSLATSLASSLSSDVPESLKGKFSL